MTAVYERHEIRKSVKRFLKQVHNISLENTPKKRYKQLVNEGVREFEKYAKTRNT